MQPSGVSAVADYVRSIFKQQVDADTSIAASAKSIPFDPSVDDIDSLVASGYNPEDVLKASIATGSASATGRRSIRSETMDDLERLVRETQEARKPKTTRRSVSSQVLDMLATELNRGMTSKQTDIQPTVSADSSRDRFELQGEMRDIPVLEDEDAPELDTRSNELLDKELPSAGLGSRPVAEEQSDSFFDRATEFLTLNEGFRNKPYKDSRGFWTVGIGHLITTEKDLPEKWKNANLTDDEVKALFKEDYNKHLNEAKKLPMYEKLNEEGKLALLDLTFNMGTTKFNEDKWPKFFSALENEDLETAAQELENSKWFNQVGNRAPRVIDLIQKASYN
jgi:GH24 family phage-related lysozyme (muramidase)